jgi:hypothetical protein
VGTFLLLPLEPSGHHQYHAPDLAKAKSWYAAAFGVDPYFDEPFYVGFHNGGFELDSILMSACQRG